MVINESFMLQIKHFHLCAGGVAVRKDSGIIVSPNSTLLTSSCTLHFRSGFAFFCLVGLLLSVDEVCCLSGGQDFLCVSCQRHSRLDGKSLNVEFLLECKIIKSMCMFKKKKGSA